MIRTGRLMAASLVSLCAATGLLLGNVGGLLNPPSTVMPAVLRDADSQSLAAMRALTAGRANDARALAAAAILDRPLNQRALTILAAAEPKRSDAINLAAALGWRDQATNQTLALLALDQGQPAVAAPRIDAIGRIQGPEAAAPLADRLLMQPAGMAALAERAAYRMGTGWYPGYLRLKAPSAAVLTRRTAFAKQIMGEDDRWNREVVHSISMALSEATRGTEAIELWRATLADPAASRTLVYDGSFERFDPSRASLGSEWQLAVDAPAVIERLAPGVRIVGSADAEGSLLRQALLLPPGRIAITIRSASGVQADRFVWSLKCYFGGLLPLSSSISQGVQRFEAEVPAGCGVASLELSLSQGQGEARLDIFSVSAAAIGTR